MTEKIFKSKKLEHKPVKACVSDIDEIIIFEKNVLNDSSEYTSKSNLKRLIQSSNSEVLVIKNKKKIYAYGIVTLRHFKNLPSGHIYKIAVLPELRNCGIATAILSELEKYVTRNNIFKLFAEVRESNKASLSLFQKLGYMPIRNLFGYYSCINNSYELENGIKLCKKIIRFT